MTLRVALVNPPFLPDYSRGQRSPAVTRSGTLYYPMWLAYAAAHVRRMGHTPLLIDAPASKLSEQETIERVKAFAPQVVLVETATPSVVNDLRFASRIKVTGTEKLVYVCGTHASALPGDCLREAPEIDGVINGEYEVPLEEIIRCLTRGVRTPTGEGIVTRSSGEKRERLRYLQALDDGPFVSEIYKEFLPIERYFNPNAHFPMVAIVFGRGCPYGCSFCVFPQTLMGRGYRQRSVDSLIAEFRWIAQHLPQVRGVFLEDDTFTTNKQRVLEFCDKLQRENLALSWTANARADVDEETLGAMKRAGVRGLCVGFESGSQTILDAMGKALTLEKMEAFAAAAQRAGVKVHGCFIVGFPQETSVTLQQTLQFAMRLPLDTAQFYPLMVYPGTRAYSEAARAGLITAPTFRDWLSPTGQHQCVVRNPRFSPEQLVSFCNFARRRFYLRKSWLWRNLKQVVTDQDERARVLRAAGTFVRHLLGDR